MDNCEAGAKYDYLDIRSRAIGIRDCRAADGAVFLHEAWVRNHSAMALKVALACASNDPAITQAQSGDQQWNLEVQSVPRLANGKGPSDGIASVQLRAANKGADVRNVQVTVTPRIDLPRGSTALAPLAKIIHVGAA